MLRMADVAKLCKVNYRTLQNWKRAGIWESTKPIKVNGEWISADTVKLCRVVFMRAMRELGVPASLALKKINQIFEILQEKEETRDRWLKAKKSGYALGDEPPDTHIYLLVGTRPHKPPIVWLISGTILQEKMDNTGIIVEVGDFLKALQNMLVREEQNRLKKVITELPQTGWWKVA